MDIGSAIGSIGGGIVGDVLGIAMEGHNDQRQLRQQQALTDIQTNAQEKLTDYNANRQLQMWKDTNYPAQVQELKQAGLNPALVYGQGGGGGVTANVNTGSVSGGQAPAGGHEQADYQGLGLQTGQMVLQNQLLKAQKENIEADTQNKLAGAKNLGASTEYTGTLNKLAGIDEKIKGKTIDDAVEIVVQQASKAYEETQKAALDNVKLRSTLPQQIEQIRQEAIGVTIRNALEKSNITVNQAQINKMTNEIAQGWEDLSQRDRRLKLDAWGKELDVQTPGVGNVIGKIFNNVLEGIDEIFYKTKGNHRTYNSPEKTGTK